MRSKSIKKKIFVLSVGRSDYDRYFPILSELKKNLGIDLYLILSSAHYAKQFGKTINFIDKKFKILKPKKKLTNFSDNSLNQTKSFSNDLIFLTKCIEVHRPDILIVLGDRYEMLLGPIAAMPFNLPVVHFYGGAVTEGVTDELVRHAITKMSHYHFVLLETYKKRLIQLGEEKWRIKKVGMHEIKFLKSIEKIDIKQLSKEIGIDLKKPYLLVTFHPVTLERKKLRLQMRSMIKAIKKTKLNAVITYPNADLGHTEIIKMLRKSLANNTKYKIIKNCGSKYYTNLMRNCLMMVGNSSSGIVEAASFKIPAVNIGTRQDGKFKPKNVIDTKSSWNDIYKNILRAKNKNFLNKIKKIKNPYESTLPVKRLIANILNLKRNDKLLRKKFINS